MRYLVLLALVLGCSSPPPRPEQPPRPPRPPAPELSADRDHPLRLALRASSAMVDSASARVEAPRAGVWWVAFDVPARPDRLSRVGASVSGPYEGFTVAAPARKVSDGRYEVDLPETATPPHTVLLQITTTSKVALYVGASRWHHSKPPSPSPPCDPEHIDRANPSCDGVYPRCDPNKPDFKNPRCCAPRGCQYGTLTCRGDLLSLDGNSGTISLGAKDEIVAFARGKLFQPAPGGERAVSDIAVRAVKQDSAWIHVERPDNVDRAKLADSWVILSAPEPCTQPR